MWFEIHKSNLQSILSFFDKLTTLNLSVSGQLISRYIKLKQTYINVIVKIYIFEWTVNGEFVIFLAIFLIFVTNYFTYSGHVSVMQLWNWKWWILSTSLITSMKHFLPILPSSSIPSFHFLPSFPKQLVLNASGQSSVAIPNATPIVWKNESKQDFTIFLMYSTYSWKVG